MLEWITDTYDYVQPKSISDETIIGVRIDNYAYADGDSDGVCVYTKALQGFTANALPVNLGIIPWESFDDFGIIPSYNVDSFLFDGRKIICTYVYPIVKDKFSNSYDRSELLLFEQIKANASSNGYKVSISDYDDSKYLGFNADFSADDSIESVIYQIAALSDKIFSSASLVSLHSINDLAGISEECFTNDYVIPVLDKLGYSGISYNHGVSELGKDIIYQRVNDFGQPIYGAVQVKVGNISGSATGKLSEIMSQIDTAFTTPFKDLSTRSDIFISECLVVCSGKYTNNANDIISGKFKGKAVIFIDGNSVINILNK